MTRQMWVWGLVGLLAAAPAAAQTGTASHAGDGPRVTLAAGVVSGGRVLALDGFVGAVGVRQAVSPRTALRLEGLTASGEARGFWTLASVEVAVTRSLYGAAGAATSFDNGTHTGLSLAVGSEIPMGAGRRATAEVRYLDADGGVLVWSVRRAVW